MTTAAIGQLHSPPDSLPLLSVLKSICADGFLQSDRAAVDYQQHVVPFTSAGLFDIFSARCFDFQSAEIYSVGSLSLQHSRLFLVVKVWRRKKTPLQLKQHNIIAEQLSGQSRYFPQELVENKNQNYNKDMDRDRRKPWTDM